MRCYEFVYRYGGEMVDGPEEQLRLTKMLGAFSRLVERERKIIMLAHNRLIEMGEEITRITDCLYESDDALDDSATNLALASDRLCSAIFGEISTTTEEEEAEVIALIEEEETISDEEEVVEESEEISEAGYDEETVEVPISVGP